MDYDGLVSAGSNLDQITWMDVRINGVVVTSRHGKPVEINALCILDEFLKQAGTPDEQYLSLANRVKGSFNNRYFCEETQCLYDVVDVDNNSVRPNQTWVLSLPFKILDQKKAKKGYQTIPSQLYNIYVLRSLSNQDEHFISTYIGKIWDRDMAYHMGTTWGF